MGNPFLEHSQDLRVIDTRDIMDTQVAVRRIETLGEKQYTKFVTERLEQCTTPVTQTLPKNKLPLFSRPPVKIKSKQKAQLAALKSDCGLFSRLHISPSNTRWKHGQFLLYVNVNVNVTARAICGADVRPNQ